MRPLYKDRRYKYGVVDSRENIYWASPQRNLYVINRGFDKAGFHHECKFFRRRRSRRGPGDP